MTQFIFSINCQLDISIQMPNRPTSKHFQTELTPLHSSIYSKNYPTPQFQKYSTFAILLWPKILESLIRNLSFTSLYIPYPTYFQIDPKYDHFHHLHCDHCSPQLPTWFLSRPGLYLQPILHSEPFKKDITPLRSITTPPKALPTGFSWQPTYIQTPYLTYRDAPTSPTSFPATLPLAPSPSFSHIIHLLSFWMSKLTFFLCTCCSLTLEFSVPEL